jgi:hypothetical protein
VWLTARDQPAITAKQPILRGPRAGDVRRCGVLLTRAQLAADMGVVPVVPGRFDQDTPQMPIPGFRNPAAAVVRPTRVLRRHQADESHKLAGRRKAMRVAEFGGNGQGREIGDAAEAAEPPDAVRKRRFVHIHAQVGLKDLDAGLGLIYRPQIGGIRLLQCERRKPEPPQPLRVAGPQARVVFV